MALGNAKSGDGKGMGSYIVKFIVYKTGINITNILTTYRYINTSTVHFTGKVEQISSFTCKTKTGYK